MNAFNVGDRVTAVDRLGYTVNDGVVEEIATESLWPYLIRSESKPGNYSVFDASEISPRGAAA